MAVSKRLILLRNYTQETLVCNSKHPGNGGCVKVTQTFKTIKQLNVTSYI